MDEGKKLIVGFKTPDAIEHAIADSDLTEDEAYDAKRILQEWVSYGENITVEFDLFTMTAKVLRRKH